MRNLDAVRERYMRDSPAVRLGGLAADLARIKSFSNHPEHRDLVGSLLEESKFFIEWTAPDADLTVQAELVELQILLAGWHCRWNSIWADGAELRSVADSAQRWSNRILEISGLLA